MSKVSKSIEKQTVVSDRDIPTRDWYAWNNLMPPKPDDFHIVGEVQVGNPSITAMLCPQEPQGNNADVLSMNLILIESAGGSIQVLTWVPARYDKILLNSTYKRVEIFYESQKIADIPVEDIH